MKKRLLSIILAIAMLFSMTVPTAFAADVKMANYSTTAGVCMLLWSDAEAMDYSVTVYNASTGAVAWSGTTSYNYLYARMIGLVSGTTYYYTVTASGSTTPAQSTEFTYDSSLETVEVIVAGATYDYYNDKLTWNSSGTIAQFKVEVYSADDNTLVRTLYTTNNYVSGDEAFQDTGSYYYKVRIVDASGNNVGDTNYWYYCPSDSTYGFSATVKVTFDACAGYFDGDETKKQITLKVDRNTCKVEAFPFDNVFMYGEVINGYYTELGYQIYEDHEFYEDTILYAHYDDCDHTTSTTSATCEEDAICSVCGMTLSAKGHNYAGGVCVNCGEAEPSEDEGSTSVTVSDSENSEILSEVIDTNTVGSATISIDTTGSAAAGSTGTLTLSSVASTVSSLTFDGSTTGSSITLTPETSANITIGETLTGKETTTSGDETNLSGTVLFYGDLSYSSLNVSGATLTLSLTVNGTVDPDSVVLLHNGTSGWERLDSSTVTNNGTLTITGTLTGLSPIMVLTVEADEPTVDYGTVWVGNVELSDGQYTTTGADNSGVTGDPTSSETSYAYYSGGVLYLKDFSCSYSHANNIDLKYLGTIQTTSAPSLTIDVTGDNTLGGNFYIIYTEDCDVIITGSGTLTAADDNVVDKAIKVYYGDLTITGGVTVTLYGKEGSIEMGYDDNCLTIDNATLNAYAYVTTDGNIIITNGSIVTSTIEYYEGFQGANVTISKNSTVTITGTGTAYHGIWACGDDNDIGILTVTDSIVTVDITGTHVYLGIGGWTATNISNSTINVSVTNTDVDEMYYFYAVGSDCGDVTISNSTVNAAMATTDADCYYSAAIYSYGGEIAITASDVVADGGILTYDDDEEVYGAIILTPSISKTLDVTLGTSGTPTSYSSATTLSGETWLNYSYIKIAQADASGGGPSHTHTYTSEVTTAATCTDNGVKTYTCTVCGETYTEEIQATGHSYQTVVTAPTCTEKGYTTYTCTTCGYSYTADETEA
ncbi:MAG: hypothetical protein LUG49_09505, partial [Oscillospiraceae bacterium]|nr:hypothetical protein [Oscillospiraceae bacterium]